MTASIETPPISSEKTQAKWLALPRMALGIILILKGISFFKDSTLIESMVQQTGISYFDSNASTVAFIITYLNLLGGFFITIGLFTRWLCLLQIPILIGAIIFVNIEGGMMVSNMELLLSIVVLILLIVYVIKGSGPVSADEFFRTYTNAGRKSGYTKKLLD